MNETSRTIITQRRPLLGIAERVTPIVLVIGFISIAIWQWKEVSIPYQAAFILAIFGAAGQVIHNFSAVEITKDTIKLVYPFKSFSYPPEQIISIEFPGMPPVFRIRPYGRRFLAYVIYPRSLRNREEVKSALRAFQSSHNIPDKP